MEPIHVSGAKHLFPIHICDSCSTSRHDLLNDKRIKPPWLHLSFRVKSLISKHLSDQVSFFKVSWFHFMIILFLFLNSIKDWNVLNPQWKQSYYPLIWAMREFHFIIFAYYHYYSFFFFCHVIFAHDVPSGIFAMPMAFSPNFCLDRPFRFST